MSQYLIHLICLRMSIVLLKYIYIFYCVHDMLIYHNWNEELNRPALYSLLVSATLNIDCFPALNANLCVTNKKCVPYCNVIWKLNIVEDVITRPKLHEYFMKVININEFVLFCSERYMIGFFHLVSYVYNTRILQMLYWSCLAYLPNHDNKLYWSLKIGIRKNRHWQYLTSQLCYVKGKLFWNRLCNLFCLVVYLWTQLHLYHLLSIRAVKQTRKYN